MFRLVITGDKDFADYKKMKLRFLEYIKLNELNVDDVLILSGDTKGTDRLAEDLANEFGLEYIKYETDWDFHGNGAVYKRNEKMIANANGLLVFTDVNSSVTKAIVENAMNIGLSSKVMRIVNCNYMKP